MNHSPIRWLTTIRATVAIVALVLAGLALPAASARAQNIALPPCGEVFEIGGAGEACLRVVNTGSPEAGPIDVFLGEAAIVEGLEYGQATEFAAVPADQQQIRVVSAGGAVDQATIDMTQDLRPGAAYQMTVSGLDREDLAPWLSGVDVTALPQGQARVRVVHASPDTGPVDVSVANGPTPFAGIPLGGQSGYVMFSADDFEFQLRESGTNTLLLTTVDPVQVQEGMNYDIFVIGESNEGTLEMVIFTADVGIAGDATPAAMITPVAAVGGTPVVVTPGAETPAAPATPAP